MLGSSGTQVRGILALSCYFQTSCPDRRPKSGTTRLNYVLCLNFAIYCNQGRINVEADGDTYHSVKDRVLQAKHRDNDLETLGWRTLRFSSRDVREQMGEYCLPMIIENINRLGGLEKHGLILRSADPNANTISQQLNLFD